MNSSRPASKRQPTHASTEGIPGLPEACVENIRVTVRVRPLGTREAPNEEIAWECADDQTIVSKNFNRERSMEPYTFDRVFDVTCFTRRVYEEGARDVALSPLTGVNATILAYGQTSSGKTFTMRGITQYAVKDIYDHIKNSPERDFEIKFSALEIYNEAVTDLLNRSSGSLRLLDDPERGTIVEKLVEEDVKDIDHLKSLINTCEAQRKVRETALNEKSSRSHQIIRLVIESCLRENSTSTCVKSLVATLNLVDLAGSERADQTRTDGISLHEGANINRSLLTLMTVIRNLSGRGRAGHVPYRNSKLTRILQPSLGGNSRTAIICTMSPALRHMEQSRNTLSFANSAKEVKNTAQVNVVVSEKQLLKHLQNKVNLLEAELISRDPPSSSSKSLLLKKDMKIRELTAELEELRLERDQLQKEVRDKEPLQLDKKKKKKKKKKSWRPHDNNGDTASSDNEGASAVLRTDMLLIAREKWGFEVLKKFETSKHPFFVVLLPISSVNGNQMNVPTQFGRLHLPHAKKTYTLVHGSSRKSGKVTLTYNETTRQECWRFGGGWKHFAKDIGLHEKDFCVFELVDDAKMLLSIFRVIGNLLIPI